MSAEATPKLTPAGEALRKFALGFPGAHEDFPWGHTAVKIGKKAFVFIAAENGETSMSAKLPESAKAAVAHQFAKPAEYGLGKHGWVTFTFSRAPNCRCRFCATRSWKASARSRRNEW